MTWNSLSLKKKLLIPLSLIIALFIIFLFYSFFLIHSVRDVMEEKNKTGQIQNQLSVFNFQLNDFFVGKIPEKEIMNQFQKHKKAILAKKVLNEKDTAIFEQINSNLRDSFVLAASNQKIENEVMALTDLSIKQSTQYIIQTSKRLVSPARTSVSNLERLVIIGASINNSANFTIKILFLKLKENLKNKTAFLEYLDRSVANAKNDVKRLARTPFAMLPVKAVEANQRIKEISLTFIKNKQKLNALSTRVKKNIQSLSKKIEAQEAMGIEHKVFGAFLWFIIVIAIITVLTLGSSFIIGYKIYKVLRDNNRDLNSLTKNVFTAAGQVSSSGQDLSTSSSEMASSMEEITTSVQYLKGVIEKNSKEISESLERVSHANELSQGAKDEMLLLEDSLLDIAVNSQRIVKIVKAIDSIAFQTNILALNASVEAARAGDSGKGFMVVAEQVKHLAQQSSDAAKETSELIKIAIDSVGHGKSIGDKVKAKELEATKELKYAMEKVQEVNQYSKEQSKEIGDITHAIQQINSVIQQTAASSEENAAVGEELKEQAETLNHVVEELGGLFEGNHQKK